MLYVAGFKNLTYAERLLTISYGATKFIWLRWRQWRRIFRTKSRCAY